MNQYLLPILGIIIPTLVGIIIAIYQNKIKKFSYEKILVTSLLNINSIIKDKLKIYFNESIIENPSLIVLKFINDGNQPIIKIDFEEDVIIKFSEGSNILQCFHSEKYPENLQLVFSHNENIVSFQPMLLNKNEYFTLNIILDNYSEEFKIIDRISGLTIEEYREPFFTFRKFSNLILISVLLTYIARILLLIFSINISLNENFIYTTTRFLTYVDISIVASLLTFFYLYKSRKKIKN